MDFDDKTRTIIAQVIDRLLETGEYLPIPEAATSLAEDLNEKLKEIIKEKYKVWVCLHMPEHGTPKLVLDVLRVT